MPCEDESGTYFTRSQIAIVKEAEALIMDDLTKRITAKEMANRFGISESSFKFYIKGILGDSYLTYFRKKEWKKRQNCWNQHFLKRKRTLYQSITGSASFLVSYSIFSFRFTMCKLTVICF